jgi:gentisate 1,2-dioxygenase
MPQFGFFGNGKPEYKTAFDNRFLLSVLSGRACRDSGKTTLKDLQPVGVIDEKHKNQQYDLLFVTTSGKDYTCRTGEKTKLKVTDFVVGSNLAYVVNGMAAV